MEATLRHDAFVYDSDERYAERALPFVEDGLAAGQAVIVAGTRDRLAIVREALGSANRRLSLLDAGLLYTRPARTVAAYYGALLVELRNAPAARVLGEVPFGPAPGEWGEWAIYEAVLNRALARLPAWLLCAYDGAQVPDRVLDLALEAHPDA